MASGIWALIGVAVGAILNALFWLLQYKMKTSNDRQLLSLSKYEELAQLLTKADNIFKTAVIETIKTTDLVTMLLNKNIWSDLNLIHARAITLIYFKKALASFDSMQEPFLFFYDQVKHIMNAGHATSKGSLNQHYQEFVRRRTIFFQNCESIIGNKSIETKASNNILPNKSLE